MFSLKEHGSNSSDTEHVIPGDLQSGENDGEEREVTRGVPV